MLRALPALLLALTPAASLAADFIGADNCKACHLAAWEAWRDSQHSRASASLSARQQKDARCLSCHAPDTSRDSPDISCETCHGGGQYYGPRYVMKDAELARLVGLVDPSEKMCLKCHDASAPSLKPFDFASKLKLIDHWTVERDARNPKKAKEKPKADPPKPDSKADAPKDKAEKAGKGQAEAR